MNRHKMGGVTITDCSSSGILTFDLRDILALLPEEVSTSVWEIKGVEATGEAAKELHAASDSDGRLDGQRLRELAAGVIQVIDGTFRAFTADGDMPWLIIQATDSSAYDVITSRQDLLDAICERFGSVRDYPSEEIPA